MINGTRYQLGLEISRQQKLSSEIARGMAEISSRKKILAPSDDPSASARISDIARTQASQVTWKNNLLRAQALGATADTTLASAKSSMDRAAELMLSASNGVTSDENRLAIALELESLAEEMATLRDTRDSKGLPVFPDSTSSVRIPVGPDLEIAAVATRDTVFGGVATAAGPRDLVAILSSAAAAVRANDPAAMATARQEVDVAVTHITSAHAEQGARSARVDDLLERIEMTNVDLAAERSGLEDVDLEEAIARIASRELSLEAAQAVFARINQTNLFDLIG